MTPTQIIKDLEHTIAQAQLALQSLKASVTPENWLTVRVNGTPPSQAQAAYATRHGCEWNWKERRDLVAKWLQFTSVETLAQRHRRTEGAIRSELQRLLYSANPDVLLDEIVGAEEE